MSLGRKLAIAVVAAGLATGSAEAATFKIGWTGAGGYTMTGLLKFADALLGTGAIDETQISDLSITVLLNNVALGTRSLLADGAGTHSGDFNVNFDTTVGQFLVGGYSGGLNGQDWFTSTGGGACDTVGFSSGSGAQVACLGTFAAGSAIPIAQSTLTATRVSEVPLPAALPLLGAALAGFGLFRRRKARTA